MAIKDQTTTLALDASVASTDIVDTQGYMSLTYCLNVINTTSLAFEHGDDSGLSDATDVAADDIIVGDGAGTVTGNDVAYTATGTANVGYVGKKRYVKVTVTNAATDATIVTILGNPLKAPTS